MASYNQQMNKSLYQACSLLSSDDIAKDRAAYFKSIIGTLNHILVGDTLWLKRFANHEKGFPSLNYVSALNTPTSLDEILYCELSALAQARTIMDEVIVQFSS